MRLANDLISVPAGGAAVRLRPTLRAAVRLHAEFALPAFVERIEQGDFGATIAGITETTDARTAHRVLCDLENGGMQNLERFREPLIELALALLAVDRSATRAEPTADAPADPNQSIADFLQSLFEIATGYLQWSPADAWAATPTEILIAQRGLIAKLKAIHGSAEDKPERDPKAEVAPSEVRDGIERLRALQARLSA